MGRAYLEGQGWSINSTEDKNGKITYSVMKTNADGSTQIEDIQMDNDEIMNKWSESIGNFAIDQYISNQAKKKLDPEAFETLMSNIVKNGEQYGANFANAIVAGIANTGKFDFSTLFNEFSKTEIEQMRGMSGDDLAAKFLGITEEEELKKLGFNSWTEFEVGFKKGLDNWDPSIYIESMNSKYENIAKENDIDVEEFKVYRKSSEARKGFENDTKQNYASSWLDNLEKTNTEKYAEALNEIAIVQTRLSKGYKSLGDNWKDWNSVMSDNKASINDINAILPELNQSLADIMNWNLSDVELLPYDFTQKYWSVIQDVYDGVDGAQERLVGLATKEYLI
jgi:hypothetical protein